MLRTVNVPLEKESFNVLLPDQGSPNQPESDSIDLPDKRSNLEDVYHSIKDTDPQRAAEVMQISQRIGEPERFVDKNLDSIKGSLSTPSTSFFNELDNQYPGTSQFLQDPKNMAVAKDDLENVAAHEGLIQKLGKAWDFEASAFKAGALQEELAFLRYGQVNGGQDVKMGSYRIGSLVSQQMGITSEDPKERISQIEKKLEELNQNKPNELGIKWGLYGATQFIPQLVGGAGYGAKTGLIGAGLAGAASLATGPIGEAVSIPIGFGVGFGAGELEYNYKLMTGLSYDQLSKVKDINGNPLPEDTMKIAAIATGAAASGLGLVKLNAILDSIPGGKEFISKFTSQATEKVLENSATYKEALTNFAQNYVKTVAHGVAAMEGITGINIAGTEIAKATTDQTFEHPSMSDVGHELLNTAGDAALTFGVLGLPGNVLGLGRDAYQANRALKSKEFYTALGDTAKASKVRERMPEKYQEMIKNITKDGPVENVYIPVDAAEEYFQSNNIDIKTAMTELGVKESYDEAVKTGGDIKIPLDEFTSKLVGTEHYAGLADDIKFHPDDLTARQVENRKTDIENKIKQISSNLDSEYSDNQAAEDIRIHIEDQLQQAGLSKSEIKNDPQLIEAFYKNIGKSLNMSPTDLFKLFPLEARKGNLNKLEVNPEEIKILEQSGIDVKKIDGTNVVDASAMFSLKKPIKQEQVSNPDTGKILTNLELNDINNRIDSINEKLDNPELSDYMRGQYANELDGYIKTLETSQRLAKAQEETAKSKKKGRKKKGEIAPEESALDKYLNDPNEQALNDNAKEMLASMEARFSPDERSKEDISKKIVEAQNPEAQPYHSQFENKVAIPNYESKPTGVIGEKGISQPHRGQLDQLAWVDSKYKATLDLIKKHQSLDMPLEINTSSDLIAREDYIEALPKDTQINFYLTSKDDALNRMIFPGNPSRLRLENAAQKLIDAGFKVKLIEPTVESILKSLGPDAEKIIERATGQGIEYAKTQLKNATRPELKILNQDILLKNNEVEQKDFKLPEKIKVSNGNGNLVESGKDRKNLDSFIKENAKQGTYTNEQTGLDINLSNSTIDKNSSLVRKNMTDNIAAIHAQVIQHIPDLIKNAIYLTTANETKNRKIDSWKYFYAPLEMNGSNYIVKLSVKETENGNTLHSYTVAKDNTDIVRPSDQSSSSHQLDPYVGKQRDVMALSDFKDKVNKLRDKLNFFQETGDKNRGRILIKGTEHVIELFKSADKSTFLHETGHMFLNIYKHASEFENASPELKADYKEVLKWLGVENSDQIGVQQHEQFARGFEAYLMEGNAPSLSLARAFRAFKNWLIGVYKHISNLNVELTPEIRGVFDRMLASQEEIERARREVKYEGIDTKELDPKISERISEFQAQARDLAESILMKEQMKELDAQHKEFLDKEREKFKAVGIDLTNQLPVFAAQREIENELGMKRGAEGLAQKFLDGKLKEEQYALFEAQAEIHGFLNGNDLAKQIIEAHATDKFNKEVQARIDEGMSIHADLKDTGKIKIEALKAIHNEKMTELLALEHQILLNKIKNADINKEISNRKKAEANFISKEASKQAREILDAKSIKDAGRSGIYITAERNAAVKVAKAIIDKDFEAAAKYKEQQMLNHALVRESMNNKMEAEKAISYLSDFQRRGNDMVNMPYGFIRQIDQLLSKFGIASDRGEAQDTLIKIAQDMELEGKEYEDITNATGMIKTDKGWMPEDIGSFIKRVNNNYYGISLPDSLIFSGNKDYNDLTMKELLDLKESIKSIANTGKTYNRFLDQFKKLDIQEAASKFKENVEAKVGKSYEETFKFGYRRSALEKKIDAILTLPDSMVPAMVNVLTLTHYLDGNELTGPAKEYIYRPLKEAEDRKISRVEKMRKEINEIFEEHYKPDELAKYKDIVIKNELGKFDKEQILMMLLNWGNEGNKDRIRLGFGIDDAKVLEMFKNLDAKDFQFAQNIWDHLQTYWPEISALEMRINGVEPKSVIPVPFKNEHGSFKGGYFPIFYDFEKDIDAYKNAEQKNELYKQYSAVKAHTDKGHTIERVNSVKKPIRLKMDVLFNHLENVVHDLEYREAVIDVNRFLNKNDTKTAIRNALGLNGMKTINEWLKSMASDQGDFLKPGEKTLRWFRFGTTFGLLAGNLKAFPMDLTGNSINTIWEIGPQRFGVAMKDFYMSSKENYHFVESKSERMRQRAVLRDRDLMDMSKRLLNDENPIKVNVRKYGMVLQTLADEAIAYPLWMEVYKRSLGEHDETTAKHIADEAITRVLGSGSKLDQVGVQRGSESYKLLSMFYSWSSMMFNRCWKDGKAAGLEYNKGNYGKAMAVVANMSFFAFFLQGLNENFWRELFRNNQQNNPDDQKKRIIARFAMQPFSYLWIGREIANFAVDRATGSRNTYRITPLESAIENIITPISDAANIMANDNKHFDQKYSEEVSRGIVQLLGAPQQLNTITFNYLDWLQNNGEFTWRDLLTRKTKK